MYFMASNRILLCEEAFMTRFGLATDNMCDFVCQNFEESIKIMEFFANFDHKMAATSATEVLYSAAQGIFIFPHH